jgi:hypothetical protein
VIQRGPVHLPRETREFNHFQHQRSSPNGTRRRTFETNYARLRRIWGTGAPSQINHDRMSHGLNPAWSRHAVSGASWPEPLLSSNIWIRHLLMQYHLVLAFCVVQSCSEDLLSCTPFIKLQPPCVMCNWPPELKCRALKSTTFLVCVSPVRRDGCNMLGDLSFVRAHAKNSTNFQLSDFMLN